MNKDFAKNNYTKRSCYECGVEARNMKLVEIKTPQGKRSVYLCSTCQQIYK